MGLNEYLLLNAFYMIQLIQTPDHDPSSFTLSKDPVSSRNHQQDPSVDMSHQLEKKRVPDFVEHIHQKGMFNK